MYVCVWLFFGGGGGKGREGRGKAWKKKKKRAGKRKKKKNKIKGRDEEGKFKNEIWGGWEKRKEGRGTQNRLSGDWCVRCVLHRRAHTHTLLPLTTTTTTTATNHPLTNPTQPNLHLAS